jgi:hypothetical protein
MSYSRFTNEELNKKFGIEQSFQTSLFGKIEGRPVSDWLRQTIELNLDFALEQGTEKARSEYIIAPVFSELRQQSNKRISIFSGIEFNVDRQNKLTGECDFLISRSHIQTFLKEPVVVAVEAKRQDFEKGYVQCTAEMIAARIFNEKKGNQVKKIYGCVTTGNVWQFLVLDGKKVLIDTTALDITEDIERIFGVLWAMSFGEIDN